MSLVYRRRVGYEVNKICQWYEEQRPGLSEEFLAEFDALIGTIVEFPQTYISVNRKVRRATMQRFPYNIFYQIESKRVVVLAVVHSARHPNTSATTSKLRHFLVWYGAHNHRQRKEIHKAV